jgi:hypothetical protein
MIRISSVISIDLSSSPIGCTGRYEKIVEGLKIEDLDMAYFDVRKFCSLVEENKKSGFESGRVCLNTEQKRSS